MNLVQKGILITMFIISECVQVVSDNWVIDRLYVYKRYFTHFLSYQGYH